MQPGAGGGDFKFTRGFDPVVTYSLHYFRDRRMTHALRHVLAHEAQNVDWTQTELLAESPLSDRRITEQPS